MGKYKPLEIVQSKIKGRFQTLKEYKQFVIDNNLTEKGYPVFPHQTYSEYPGVDAFLGNPEGTAHKLRVAKIIESKPWVRSTEGRKKAVVTPKVDAPVAVTQPSLSMVEITKSLLERNISLRTMEAVVVETTFTIEEARQVINLILQKQMQLVK